jgi:hypothetical protein
MFYFLVSCGLLEMTHPRGEARRLGDPQLISGLLAFVNKGVST